LTNLASGTHNFKVRAVDIAGNVDSTAASFSWKILTPAEAVQKLIDTIRSQRSKYNLMRSKYNLMRSKYKLI
jgi:hypothetical protein